jgi:hypothetical protein
VTDDPTRVRLAIASRPRWPIGRFAIPTAADPQRPRIQLNRYPGEVIGIAFYPGGRRYLSWVWPIRLTGLRLTGDQFDREVRSEVLDRD